MADWEGDGTWRSVRAPVRERAALQEPGHDEVLRRVEIPDTTVLGSRDRRLFLDVVALEHALAVARSSPTMRAVFHGVRLVVEQRRSRDGHVYEVWSFESAPPVPEWTGAEATTAARHR